MRIIAHFDMDAFFALVEEKDKPYLKGLPVVIGADPKDGFGRGVVSTANYKAREYGVHSAQPISVTWRLSEEAKKSGKPAAVFLSPRIERYEEVSGEIMAILRKYGTVLEQVGIDEAYLDIGFTGSFKKAGELAKEIKEKVKKKEGLTVSVGIGPNKLIAKIASDMEKPDGLTVVVSEKASEFLKPLSINWLPGVGPKTEAMFNGAGIKTVADLRKLSKKKLQEMMGKRGVDLYEKARGRDDSPLVEKYEMKSIGGQETFMEDTGDPRTVSDELEALCQRVFSRFSESGFKTFKTICIVVRFADFETKVRSRTLRTNISSFDVFYLEAFRLLLPFFDHRENPRQKLFRLVGVRLEKLE